MRVTAVRSCSPQSQRKLPRRSPVKHAECKRTGTSAEAGGDGQVGRGNLRALVRKEVLVGLLNGLVWAIVVGSVSALWFRDVPLGAVIAGAMMINLIAAALAGVLVPLTLRRMSVDPALAGGVVLTTFTDVIGFLSFLGLATLVLLR